jgi:crossover junction endodeoxyribonuclease RuvC
MRIIGIDPGSRVTGYGVIACQGGEIGFVSCGAIRLGKEDFSLRLGMIFDGLSEVIDKHCPVVAAIEDLFVAHNVRSALKLGQARGVAVVAARQKNLEVFDYSPRKIKQSVVGYGHAEKGQVQEMVKMLLELDSLPGEDAADGLAAAICHANHLMVPTLNGGCRTGVF